MKANLGYINTKGPNYTVDNLINFPSVFGKMRNKLQLHQLYLSIWCRLYLIVSVLSSIMLIQKLSAFS